MHCLSRAALAQVSRLGSVIAIFALSATPASSQSPFPTATPAEVGLSAEKLEAVTRALQAHVDAGDIAGAVAAVVRNGKLVYSQAVGRRDIESASPMTFDSLFRVYSMSRPMASLGILMLQDEGRLNVNDAVKKYLPKFSDQPVLVDPGAAPDQIRPRKGDITLANLMTHTSGFGNRESRMYVDRHMRSWDQPLQQVVDNMAAVPLFEDPGTAYRYGESADVLGRVIEVVTGMKLEDFYKQRIFGPLGMSDAVYYVDPARRSRLATVYRPLAGGKLQPFEIEPIPVTEHRALISAVGLVASTTDYLRFSQFFLDNGNVKGRLLLSPQGVQMAETNAIPQTVLPIGKSGYNAGTGWSLGGFAVVMNPAAYDHTVSRGEFWWDGSAGTRFWIDPRENMVTVIMAQVQPSDGGHFREQFKTLVYDAIEKHKTP
jgi:CubicO group peptidase (beta-lactamase class C family)